jgi:hypothetical protein
MTCKCRFKIGDKVKWNGVQLFAIDSWLTYYMLGDVYTIQDIESSETQSGDMCHFMTFKEYEGRQGWGCPDLKLVKRPKHKLPFWW